MKRVFNVDIESRRGCLGAVDAITSNEGPLVVKKILNHPGAKVASRESYRLRETRAPPQAERFD